MESERPAVNAALGRSLASEGYVIRRKPHEHAGGKWLVRFTSALGGNAILETDVNYMAHQPLFGLACLELLALGGTRASEVPVLDLHELVAGKLVALCRKNFAFLLDLTANERAFLSGVLDRGEIDANLLDTAPEIRTRIASMSMLKWKTRHVRKHRGLEV